MLLNYHAWGSASGKPALLVHGAVDSWTTWKRVGPWLAERGWHVIAVDLRGHGRSPVDPGTWDRSLSTMAADLVETVASARPDVPGVELLIGHSLGATVCLVAVTDHPSFAQRLVLEDPSGPRGVDHAELAREIPGWIAAARSNPDAIVQEGHADPRVGADDWSAKVDAIAAADPTFVAEVVEQLGEVFDHVENCPLPILALLGRDEIGQSVMVGDDRVRFHTVLRGRSLVELDAGHDLHQAVFDDFVRYLAEWLAETDPDSFHTAGVRVGEPSRGIA